MNAYAHAYARALLLRGMRVRRLCVTASPAPRVHVLPRRPWAAIGALQLTVVSEATFVEWLQRLQASAYLFSLGGASVHAPVTAIVMRVLTINNASALFQNMSLAVVVSSQARVRAAAVTV